MPQVSENLQIAEDSLIAMPFAHCTFISPRVPKRWQNQAGRGIPTSGNKERLCPKDLSFLCYQIDSFLLTDLPPQALREVSIYHCIQKCHSEEVLTRFYVFIAYFIPEQ